ncbi:MAG TPA: hypothetical protein VFB16_09365 [Bauldia sp.]|nr:hypothetical protein [Bauldia sp.]
MREPEGRIDPSKRRSTGGSDSTGTISTTRRSQPGNSPPRQQGPLPTKTLKDAADDIADSASDIAEVARETIRTTARAVSEQVGELASHVGEELEETAAEQKKRGAAFLENFAQAVGRASEDLRAQSPAVSNYIRDAAKSVEKFSGTIRNRSVGDLLEAAGSFARQRPEAFVAGAVAAGFVISRFLKSTKRTGTKRPNDANGSTRMPTARTRSAAESGGHLRGE